MATTERLRAEIDSGRTGDKVAGSDPAAAPLGTDDEAAGTPPRRNEVELARSHEVAHERRQTDDNKLGGALRYMTILAGVMIILTALLLYVVGLR